MGDSSGTYFPHGKGECPVEQLTARLGHLQGDKNY